MRQETIKALETRRNSVMAERKKSHMQTLGASHDMYGIGGTSSNSLIGVVNRNHRNSVASMSVKDVFENPSLGQVNRAFEPGHDVISEDELETANALRLQARNGVNWRDSSETSRSNSRI